MTRAVVRVREEFQRYEGMAASDAPRGLYATKKIFVRYEKCGEIINREMVATVCAYYQADADKRWRGIIEQFGGPEEVSPEFQLNPMFLNPRLMKRLQSAAEKGGWSEPDSKWRANRKRIERWLRTQPRVTFDVERIMEHIYNLADSSTEAKQLVANWFEHAEDWLRAFPDKKISSEDTWTGSLFIGADLGWLARRPEDMGNDGQVSNGGCARKGRRGLRSLQRRAQMEKIKRADNVIDLMVKDAPSRRTNQSWNKTPERRLLKCVLGHLVRGGLARAECVREFKRLVPKYQSFFDPPR